MKELTEKQYTFVNNYISNGFNIYQAAISAGYDERYANADACKLLNHPAIKQRINKAHALVIKANERLHIKELAATMEDKIKVLTRIIREIVPLDESQPIKLDYVKDAIKAISELNKMSGDYAPDKRLSVTVDATQTKLIEARKQYEEY